MRIMWFTNIAMPAMDRHAGRKTAGSGWWMSSLLDKLKDRSDIQLAVVTALPSWEAAEFSEDGVDYFVLPQSKIVEKFSAVSRFALRGHLERCAAIVKRWKPDLLHIHGTERFYGLMKVRGLIDTPMVVSIQGLMGPYARKALGELFPGEVLSTYRLKELLFGGLWSVYRKYRRGTAPEAAILRSAAGVLGRTDWDRAFAWATNPDGVYFHSDEMMRPAFFEENWQLDQCNRHQIVCTSGLSALKGVHVAIEAVRILRQTVPDVKLKVAAGGLNGRSGFARLIQRKIHDAGLSESVDLLGWVDAESLRGHLRQSNCFTTASFIENGCNALAEAMLIGLPCVVGYTGGMINTLDNEKTGLLVPTGDPPLLADRINRIFKDDDLAVRLGVAAKERARARHDPQRIVDGVVTAYRTVLGNGA